MRISTVALTSVLLLCPLVVSVQAEEAQVHYKGGTIIETHDMDLKFNVQLQPQYSYSERDSDRGEDEVSNFALRRARFHAGGTVQNKQFSFKLMTDFASNGGGGDLKDVWLQWNNEPANIRIGQFQVPFTRQYNVSSSQLFFIERSEIIGSYNRDRDRGVMLHGALGDLAHYYVGLFNGEARNESSDDTKHLFATAVDFASSEYGTRGLEGDLDGGALGYTAGLSSVYQEEEGAGVDTFAATADAGLRIAGFDVQTEFFLEEPNSAEGDPPSFWGFYTQTSYVVDRLGVGLRYGLEERDNFEGVKDLQEFTGVLNYFIDDHALKAQLQGSFYQENLVGGDRLTDFLVIAQLSAYL